MKLAEQGLRQLAWAEQQMSGLLEIRKRFAKEQPLKDLKIGMALHITKETGVLVRTLVAGGAKVAISGCNPLSTQDDVAAALASEGHLVYGWKGLNTEEYYQCLNAVLDFEPDLTIDDGCDLVHLIHTQRPELLDTMIGGCEETTTGVTRLRAMEKDNALKLPIIAVNDNKTKHLLDNYYGSGQSTLDGILRGTNILFAGKTIVVIGYGDCGKGVALRAKGLGSQVIVTEVDPFKALQAHHDGFRVMSMNQAVKEGDVFVTVTGNKHVIRLDHMKAMKSGAILSNSGHFDIEIDYAGLKQASSEMKEIRPLVEEFSLNGKKIVVLGQARLVNLALGEGHPSEVMSTSFAGQALSCEYLVKNKGKLPKRVITLPESIDQDIAAIHLQALGITIDRMDEEQRKYSTSWEEGT